jgi:hypothetical protein
MIQMQEKTGLLPLVNLSLKAVAVCSLMTASITCLGQTAQAQKKPKPAEAGAESRFDIYAEYGYVNAFDSGITGAKFTQNSNQAITAGVAGYFNRFFGLEIEGAYFVNNNAQPGGTSCANGFCQLQYTVEAGPVLRVKKGPFTPFLHVLGGGAGISGPVTEPLFGTAGSTVTAGVGLDLSLHHHIAWRVFQADYLHTPLVYGSQYEPAGASGAGKVDMVKLSSGIVFGGGAVSLPRPVELGCTATPTSVFPGDPLNVQSSVVNLANGKKVTYLWSTTGGTITSKDSTEDVNIATTGLAPGDYVVKGHLLNASNKKEIASCDAPFTVRRFEPPSITCSANPTSATVGTDIAISTVGVSPQNRGLTYSYTATAGEIKSTGPTAILSTTGLTPGPDTVTCNVVDDLGQSASYKTDVTIIAPVQAATVATESLCSVSFERDIRRPARVDNEAKACLDDIALTLRAKSDARLIVVGNFAPSETDAVAAERALNVKQYLVQEGNVDSSRIELRVGGASAKTVSDTLVPAGAFFKDETTHPFDESKVVRHGESYGHHKKKGLK